MVWMGSGLMWIIEDLYIYVYTFKYKKATVSVINYVHLFVPQEWWSILTMSEIILRKWKVGGWAHWFTIAFPSWYFLPRRTYATRRSEDERVSAIALMYGTFIRSTKTKLLAILLLAIFWSKIPGLDNKQASHGVGCRVKGRPNCCFEMLMGLCVGECFTEAKWTYEQQNEDMFDYHYIYITSRGL